MICIRKVHPSFGVEIAAPTPPAPLGPGQLRVKVEWAGICGTDLHVHDWSGGYDRLIRTMPFTLGHELSGIVEDVAPGVTTPAMGDRVTVLPGIACGQCRQCLQSQPESCDQRTALGLGRDGAFAPSLVAPADNCILLPDALGLDLAALAEPLAVCMRSVLTGEIGKGQTVAVLGAGMIGLGIAILARLAGARTIVIGKADGYRLSLARALNFDLTLDLDDQTAEEFLADHGIAKVDRAFEATGVAQSITDGLSILRQGGILVCAGIHAQPATLDLTAFVRNRQQLRGTHSALRSDWHAVLGILAEHGQEFRPLISHRLPLARAQEGFDLARSRQAMKVLLKP